MQSNCIREASKACFNSCCHNPLHSGLPSPPPPRRDESRRNFVAAILSTIHPDTNFTNHESLPSSRELLSSLKNAIPNYLNSVIADDIRTRDYYHLTHSNHVCLDYIGHGLFSYSQKQSSPATETASSSVAPPTETPFFDLAYAPVNLSSYLLYGEESTEFEAKIKRRLFNYMNLLEEDYSLVFTPNQSSAFKILAESYPFKSHPHLLTVYDYDNEAARVMIEAATKRGGRHHSAAFSWPSLKVNSRKLRKIVVNPKINGLFAFPLQSRMTGARYSYQWMNLARENGWHILLDATSLAAKEMETLGLSLFQPDFLICSFFNIFGYNPSGFCCLFIKKSRFQILNQSPTAIGIVNLVPPTPSSSSAIDEPGLDLELHETPPFKATGLDHADTLGLILISSRLRCLTNWLVNALLSLKHPRSGLQLITLCGPRVRLDRGPALAFNVCDWKGERVEPALVQKLAGRNNISLSVGFLKNVVFSESFEEDKERLMQKNGKNKRDSSCGVEVVSASLGMLSNFEDVYRLWAFVSRFLDADFVEKEKWRYTALNQTTVEV